MFHKFWSGSILLMGLCRGLWVTAAGWFFPMREGSAILPNAVLWYAVGWPCSPA